MYILAQYKDYKNYESNTTVNIFYFIYLQYFVGFGRGGREFFMNPPPQRSHSSRRRNAKYTYIDAEMYPFP
jgi:hypothetical protein